MATNFPTSLDTFTNPNSGNTLDSPSHSVQHSDINDAVEAIETKVGIGSAPAGSATSGQVLMKGATNTTWSSITSLSNGTASNFVFVSPEENFTISATAASGTVALDMKTTSATFFTSDASGNWAVNLRGDASTTLDSLLSTNQSITHVFLATQGGTAYYPNAFFVDGGTVTPKFQGGAAFSAGNISSIDSYSFTAIKTAGTTFTVLASQTQFK
jgi:hypothetical protein